MWSPILEGSDPVLKHEYVAVGAHYDHLGTATKPDAAGDTVYNGADDDGSGTVSVLSMAEAFATVQGAPEALASCSSGTQAKRRGCGARGISPTTPRCRSTTSSRS